MKDLFYFIHMESDDFGQNELPVRNLLKDDFTLCVVPTCRDIIQSPSSVT